MFLANIKKFIMLTLMLLAFVVSSSAQAADPIGKVLAIKGVVKAINPNGSVRTELKLLSPIYANEALSTAKGSKVQVVFNDKSLFTLAENSEVVLDKYAYNPETDEGTSIIEVTKGIFKFLTGKIAKKDSSKVKVHTPSATIGVRGSGGIVQVAPSGDTILALTQCCLDLSQRQTLAHDVTTPSILGVGGEAATVNGIVKLSKVIGIVGGSGPTGVGGGSEEVGGSAKAVVVPLNQVGTFSQVLGNGEISDPAPVPLGMLTTLNSALSSTGMSTSPEALKLLPSVEESGNSPKIEKKAPEGSIGALVQEKQENSNPTEEGSKPKTGTPQPLSNKPAAPGSVIPPVGEGGGLLATFGSGSFSNPSVDPASEGLGFAVVASIEAPVNTAESQQQERATDTFNEGSTGIGNFGDVLVGTWGRKNAAQVEVEFGAFNAVVDKSNNKIIFENQNEAGDSVQERVVLNDPGQARALEESTAEFGDIFVYRGLHDHFISAGTIFSTAGAGITDFYEFTAGISGQIDETNQRTEGERLFFNFIPSATDQFINFNLASGISSQLTGSHFEGERGHTDAGLVVDYTNDNNQFVGGNVGFSKNLGGDVYDYSFEFMAGEMLTTGGQAMDGSVYSFSHTNDLAYGSVIGSLSTASDGIYGTVNGAIKQIDAYDIEVNTGTAEYAYAVNIGSQPTPVVTTPDTIETLRGYSAGYVVRNAYGIPNPTMIGNTGAPSIQITRNDTSSGGVDFEASFTYQRINIVTGNALVSGNDTLEVGFGGAGADKAFVSHNIYGAEESQDSLNYDATGSTFGGAIAVADVNGGLLSSYFVDIPDVPGLVETCQDCQFLTWGVWAADIELSGQTGIGQLVPYVVGDVSNLRTWAELNTNAGSVDVNYNGIIVGAVSGGSGANKYVNNDVGHFNATANFNTRTVDFDGSFVDYHFSGSQGGIGGVGVGADFTEMSLGTLERNGTAVTGNATISGAFYGNNAENIGGNFNFNDITNSVTGAGIFAGKKQ